ncbi:MAG TPA: gas vesicle protein K [Terriglobales bacterium]|nr:gas vesicle protein K [Terriglobales bacterium]
MSDSEPRRLSPEEIEAAVADFRRSLEQSQQRAASRIDCSPENVEQGVARLVLGLVELLRQVLERQAIRRMEGGSLTDEQVEQMGLALMRLEQKVREMAREFGLRPEDLEVLNINLGPVGNLVEK